MLLLHSKIDDNYINCHEFLIWIWWNRQNQKRKFWWTTLKITVLNVDVTRTNDHLTLRKSLHKYWNIWINKTYILSRHSNVQIRWIKQTVSQRMLCQFNFSFHFICSYSQSSLFRFYLISVQMRLFTIKFVQIFHVLRTSSYVCLIWSKRRKEAKSKFFFSNDQNLFATQYFDASFFSIRWIHRTVFEEYDIQYFRFLIDCLYHFDFKIFK